MGSTAFYISKKTLSKAINRFETEKIEAVEDKSLKGFVLRLGQQLTGEIISLNPLYSDDPELPPDYEVDMEVQNEIDPPVCPYPPGYETVNGTKSNP